MRNFLKVLLIVSLVFSIFGCAEKLSPKRSQSEQQEVKTQVMQLLKEEYKQPFRLEKFNYKYETQYPNASGNKPYVIYGTFYFKIQAVDNPIILLDFKIDDDKKESIKDVIDSFKKNQLNERYCRGFAAYYLDVMNNRQKIIQPYTMETEKYCDAKNQRWYKEYKNYYLKHKDEYK